MPGGRPWRQTDTTKLGLPDRCGTIKGLVVCNNRDLEPLDLQNGLALGCYQPSPKVLIVLCSNIEAMDCFCICLIYSANVHIKPDTLVVCSICGVYKLVFWPN